MGSAQSAVTAAKEPAEPGSAPVSQGTKGSLSGSFAFGEQVIKIAGLLAVFGYMEFRAHLNYLGISATVGLGSERYLAEFYSMFSDLVLRAQVFSSLIFPIILGAAVVFFIIRVSDRTGKARRVMKQRLDLALAFSVSPWMPGLLLLILIGFQLWFLSQLSGLFPGGQFVGPLHVTDASRPEGANLFLLLLAVVLAASAISWILSPRSGEAITKQLWNACWLLLMILGLIYLPNLYGTFVRDTNYPRISIKSDSAARMCGLLVLQSDEMRIWTVSGKVGRITVVRPSDAGAVVIGASEDLVALTRQAASGKTINYCPE